MSKVEIISVAAILRAKKGEEAEVKKLLLAQLAPSRAETGCLNYDLHQAVDDPGVFVFYENWESAEDLAAHAEAPHLAASRTALHGKVESREIFRLKKIER